MCDRPAFSLHLLSYILADINEQLAVMSVGRDTASMVLLSQQTCTGHQTVKITMTNIKIRKHEQIRSQCSELHTLSFCRKWRSRQHVFFPVLSSSEPLTWLRTHQHNHSSSVLVESMNKTVPSPPPVTELTSYINTVAPARQVNDS